MNTSNRETQQAGPPLVDWIDQRWDLPLKHGRFYRERLQKGWLVHPPQSGPESVVPGFSRTCLGMEEESSCEESPWWKSTLPAVPGWQAAPLLADAPERVSLNRRLGFTLIELLVVIAIIAILAGLLLPVLATIKEKGRIKQAEVVIKNLAAAVSQYHSTYSRYPASKPAETFAGLNDLTYGLDPALTNSEVMIILMDRPVSFNTNHERNPQHLALFNPSISKAGDGPGLGDDLVLRDPWRNPYVISMDLNGDDKVVDEYYTTVMPDGFIYAPVAIWSRGPDGKYGTAEDDKDNILGWE